MSEQPADKIRAMENEIGQLEMRLKILKFELSHLKAVRDGDGNCKKREDPVDKTPAAQRVFAVPELLEQILLSLDLHTRAPFSYSSFANASQLCRLELVNRNFRDTIQGSTKLQQSRSELDLNISRHHLAVVWLLRELGYGKFGMMNCGTFGCRISRDDNHKCDNPTLRVDWTPSYFFAEDYKSTFCEALTRDTSWRCVKVSRHIKIIFPNRCYPSNRVDVDGPTLAEVWEHLQRVL